MLNLPVVIDEEIVAKSDSRLFIFAEARSGSNWLVETLNSHCDIVLLKEIIQPGQRNEFYGSDKKDIAYDDNDIQYLEKQLQTIPGRLKGCKILFPQSIRFMDLYQFVYNYRNAKYILLRRENSIKGEVSGFIARSFSSWHVESDPGMRRIKVDPEFLYQRVVWRELATSFSSTLIKLHCPNVLSVTYEDLFSNNQKVLLNIFTFLGLDNHGIIQSREVKSNQSVLQEILINYQEVRNFFLNKPHLLAMFD